MAPLQPVRDDVSVIVSAYRGYESLPLVLLALCRQTVLPAEVIVADDGSEPPLIESLSAHCEALPFALWHVWQPDAGFRAARSRNNAIYVAAGQTLGFLDQDTVPYANWLETHLRTVRPGRVCLARIFPLTESQTREITTGDIQSGSFEALQAPHHWKKLQGQQRKYRFYALMRRLRLPFKPTRPPLSSGNISAWRDDLFAVNGFDEAYIGWGQEDDDLGRRMYMNGVRPMPLVTSAFTAHLWHPEHHAEWDKGANLTRYRQRLRSCRCGQGLDSHPHTDVCVTQLH